MIIFCLDDWGQHTLMKGRVRKDFLFLERKVYKRQSASMAPPVQATSQAMANTCMTKRTQ